ncbi:MAG: 6,7-dimethyl-8-ribityllumazine synthase [Candidatus Glassbacteria bacterium]
MPRTTEGKLRAKGLRFALVVSRFNELIGKRLIEGAADCLVRHEVSPDDIEVIMVPGVMEIPPVCKRVSQKGKYSAIIALGTVIRGDTPHFEFVARGVTSALARLNIETKVPVIFGILTADNLDQALERSGGKLGNRGWHAALAAIEMTNLYSTLGDNEKEK